MHQKVLFSLVDFSVSLNSKCLFQSGGSCFRFWPCRSAQIGTLSAGQTPSSQGFEEVVTKLGKGRKFFIFCRVCHDRTSWFIRFGKQVSNNKRVKNPTLGLQINGRRGRQRERRATAADARPADVLFLQRGHAGVRGKLPFLPEHFSLSLKITLCAR